MTAPDHLSVTIGQHSSAGRKPANQDFYGALIPGEPGLTTKGIAIALADGISSSAVSAVAASSAIRSFLTDYYATSDAWSVKNSAQRVIAATNSWLHAETRRGQFAHDPDRGYVCTLDVLVLKSGAAHVFHIGDGRVWRVAGRSLEQLTQDHRVTISPTQSYLGRALGVAPHVEIDHVSVPIQPGDILVLTTDGVHDFIEPQRIVQAIAASADLDAAAAAIVAAAHAAGSPDNLTIQIVRVDSVPPGAPGEVLDRARDLPPAPILEERALLDGYRVRRTLHSNSRSHLHLATDEATGATVVLKTPSIDLREDPEYLRRFMMEEWIARRINNPHVMRAYPQTRPRTHLYLVLEYLDGQSLTQWMLDHPKPELEAVRRIVEQAARGLAAFHRKEMVHQDVRPENLMIDASGTVTVIDFGSTKVAGVLELTRDVEQMEMLGTAQFTAPECFFGEPATAASDVFSLGVTAYQLLTGTLPYGAAIGQMRTRAQQRALVYRSVRHARPDLPDWVDGALRKAVHPLPAKRYGEMSEFVYDLRHPNPDFAVTGPVPLLERNPVMTWKIMSGVLAAALIVDIVLRVR